MEFPASHAELTGQFLSDVLGHQVLSYEVDHSMTAEGVLADAYRVFNIEYSEQGKKGPSSLFVKSTKTIPEIVELCKATGAYSKEVYFYSELNSKIAEVIRVPQCLALLRDDSDETCSQFCILMEDFASEEWVAFEQMKNPMNYEDMADFMRELARLHAHCWHFPHNEQTGLGDFRPHWQLMNDEFVDQQGNTSWDQLLPKWQAVYGCSLLSEVDEAVRQSIEEIAEVICSGEWPAHQTTILSELQRRPRTITHGDARGNNIFRSRTDGSMAFIDWQMWAAGPACNEFSQVWMNSFSLESGMVFRLEELTRIYYDTLVSLKPDIESEYPFDQLLADIKIIFLNTWIQYLGFTLGMLDGYTDPAQADAKENWRLMMIRNMQTLHHSETLDALKQYQ